MIKHLLSIFVFAVLLTSCGSDSKSSAHKTAERSPYQAAAEAYNATPSKETAMEFIRETQLAIAQSDDLSKNQELLSKGLATAEEYKLAAAAIGFLMPLVKDYPKSDQREEHLAKLASALQDVGKSIPGDMLISSYLTSYPEGTYNETLVAKRKEDIQDPEAYLMTLAEKIFEDPDKFGINRINTQKYVDACEAFALGYPDHEKAPDFLYRAAEMARTLKTYPKALSIYQWIGDRYPSYEKSATTLFLKGFMLENELNDKAAAKMAYQDFLQRFPTHDLTDDVKFLLENIDKSDEEIMKLIDEKAKKNQ